MVAPSNSRYVYAANDVEIFASTDGGASWRSKFRPSAPPVRLLAVDPRDPTRLFALFPQSGTLLVDLGGDRGIGLALLDAEASSLAFVSPRSTSTDGVLAATRDGLYLRSTSTRWKRAGLSGRALSHVAVSPHDPKLWFVVEPTQTNPRFSLGQLFRSTDGGKTWTESTLPTGGSFRVGAPFFDSRDPNVVYQLAGKLRASHDRGATWQETAAPAVSFDVQITALGRLYASTETGLRSSTDGGESWQLLGGGPRSGPPDLVSDFALAARSPREIFASGVRGLWRSTDLGGSWQARNEGIFGQATTSISRSLDGRTLYLGAPAEGVFRADLSAPRPPRGLAWSRKSAGLPADPTRAREFLSQIKADPLDIDRVWNLSSRGLFVSANRGDSWQRVALDGWSAQHRGGVIEIDPNDPRRIVVSATRIVGSEFTGIAWLTDDHGASWRRLGFAPEASVSGLAFDAADATRLWAATLAGLLTSIDSGRTWTSIQATVPPTPFQPSVTGVWADPRRSGEIYVSLGSYGFYKSGDGGETYEAVWVGIPGETPLVLDIEFGSIDRTQYFVRAQALTTSGPTRNELWRFFRDGDTRERLTTSRAPALANDFVLDLDDPFRLFAASEVGAYEVTFRP